MSRLPLAIGVCAALGLLGGLGYAALTPPPFTAQAMVLLPSGAPMPAQAGAQRVTSNIVSVNAHGRTAAQALAADAAAVHRYLARAKRAQLLSEAFPFPRHDGGRLSAFAALGVLVGSLAGAVGALSARMAYRK